MKVFIGFVLVVAIVSAGASASAVDRKHNYGTCLRKVNEITKDFVPARPIRQLVTKLESILDLQKMIELTMSSRSSYNSNLMSFIVNLETPNECKALIGELDRLRRANICMGKLSWVYEGPKDIAMEGSFGRFMRACLACSLTREVEYPDECCCLTVAYTWRVDVQSGLNEFVDENQMFVCVSCGASSYAAVGLNFDTCVQQVNDLTKKFVPAESIEQFLDDI